MLIFHLYYAVQFLVGYHLATNLTLQKVFILIKSTWTTLTIDPKINRGRSRQRKFDFTRETRITINKLFLTVVLYSEIVTLIFDL